MNIHYEFPFAENDILRGELKLQIILGKETWNEIGVKINTNYFFLLRPEISCGGV